MRLQVNRTGFKMPMYTTHALRCVRLQVNIIGYEIPFRNNRLESIENDRMKVPIVFKCVS